ncbi:hypothetical protein SAMN05421810_109107 [Amycolatopsis arida]|uniref:DUF6545 domain-containing protein n=1 Tax=Amycolatopsis arida TaxID=587909 RepID=A0A1I5ZFC8_9PSEU|nr:MAB_1171c family putative transporter [Amycolatopsis arida]TDX89585.1 hypothetical protein CLV69_109106 [Amycolatopsis arida]SFQ54847.1 hypothetical protein SAMN05421810_109107 [Amycolatopsis arida]
MGLLSMVLGVVLIAALGWKLHQLAGSPHDRPLRAVTSCLACAAVAFPFGLPFGAAWLDGLTVPGTAKLLQNVLLLCTVYFLMCFYLYSAADLEQGSRRARWELVPLVAVIVVISVAMYSTPTELRGLSYGTADMTITSVATFYFVAGCYLIYALVAALYWTLRRASATRPPVSVGLRLAAAGMAGMSLGATVRGVVVVIRWLGGRVPPILPEAAAGLLAVAIPLFVVGIAYPAAAMRLAALRVWWQHRRIYHRLRPLWMILQSAYPEFVLGRVPAGRWRDAVSLRGVHRRYYRRVIECRDGLVRISPYLEQVRAEAGVEPASPAELAALLREALRAQAEGRPVGEHATPVAVPVDGGGGLDADVRELVTLAEALQRKPT